MCEHVGYVHDWVYMLYYVLCHHLAYRTNHVDITATMNKPLTLKLPYLWNISTGQSSEMYSSSIKQTNDYYHAVLFTYINTRCYPESMKLTELFYFDKF